MYIKKCFSFALAFLQLQRIGIFLPVFRVSESSVNRYSTVSQYKCGYKSCLFPKMPDKEKKGIMVRLMTIKTRPKMKLCSSVYCWRMNTVKSGMGEEFQGLHREFSSVIKSRDNREDSLRGKVKLQYAGSQVKI